MKAKMKSFLKDLSIHLKKMPEEERMDITKEIESHMLDKIKNGMSEEEVLTQLGDPKTLAKSYLGDYLMKQESNRPRSFIQRFAFLMSVNLVSSIVALFLGAIGFAFGLSTIVLFLSAIISAIFNGLDYTGISTNLSNSYSEIYHLPTLSELPAAFLVAIFLGFITFMSVKLLQTYFHMVTQKYRKLLPDDLA
jgi:uncharacterized membrane protein